MDIEWKPASVLSLEDINVTVEKGIDFITAIETEGHDVTHCYLTTPSGKVIDFNPEEKIVNDKYELNINDETKCSVIIKDLNEDDSGDWVLRYNYGDQTDKQNYHITVSSDIKSNSDRHVQYLTARRFNTVLGATHTILMEVASFSTSESCFLVTPAGVTHTLTASTQIPGVQVVTGSGIECGVTITVTNDNIGEWTLVGWSTFFSRAIERRLPITIYVEGLVTEPEPAKRTLQQIDHVTRAGAIFDISLSRTANQEECFLTTPQGQTFALTAVSISGVTVRSASNYVNCRVTIGPMEPRLIGIWSLCGRRTGGLERCQPANVTWYSDTDPTSEWEINMKPQFDYNVNFGGFVNPSVSGFGELLTCQVITPSGEDLALTGDTDYPGIKRNSLGLPAVCSVQIGPIDSTMLGEWVVYTKVHSPFFGFSEIQLPFTFNLYNKDDPYAQAYNVTKLDPINRVINIGNTITVEVTGTGSVEGCYYTTPTGVTYSSSESNQFDVTFENVGTNVACRAIIGPISETMIGMREIIGKFSDVGSYTEKHQVVHILIEDPENPIEEDHRRVDILPPQTLNTELGARHTVTIPLYSFTTVQSCHVRTPDGLQYKLMDGFNLPGVVIEHSTTAACAISITVEREDMVGEWMLISRAVVFADAVEQRLSFTIHVEENVEAFPSEITIVEGNDLYVRLSEPIDATDSCNLVGPNENIVPDVDTGHENACGFIVRDIGTNGSGEWQIVYGNNVIHRAFINVTVVAKADLVAEDIVLYKHGAVNQTFGPENSVYCRLRDPRGNTVFEGFGRCNLVIDRVTSEHEGKWTMAAGIMGQVVLDEQEFQVIVINEDSTPVVITHVEKQRPEVILSCKLSSPEPVKMCKFRDPHGAILLASQGVGQYHYTVLGIEIGLESELTSNECGLRITNPTTADLGLWRCAMETESHTYFGFLPVLCPWALQDPEVQAAVTTEPILTADRTEISAIEGDSVTMSCSIQAPIHYCYFRRQNGTTFSVSPGTANAAMEYVGAGFEAGECGVRFKNLIAIDSGSWSCHVGLKNDLEPEQRALFNVIVKPQITLHLGFSGNEVIAEGNISMPGVLEYCRFVRMDGLGFTSQSVPEGFTFVGSLEDKRCAIRIGEPTILNIHPWVIAAKLVGMDVEISGTTTDDLFILPGDQSDDSGHIRVVFLWVIICLLSTLILLLLFTFIPKIDKKWFHDKMSRKQPVQNYTA